MISDMQLPILLCVNLQTTAQKSLGEVQFGSIETDNTQEENMQPL